MIIYYIILLLFLTLNNFSLSFYFTSLSSSYTTTSSFSSSFLSRSLSTSSFLSFSSISPTSFPKSFPLRFKTSSLYSSKEIIRSLAKCEQCNFYYDIIDSNSTSNSSSSPSLSLSLSSTTPTTPSSSSSTILSSVCPICNTSLISTLINFDQYCLKIPKRKNSPTSSSSSSSSSYSPTSYYKHELFLAGLPFSYTEEDINKLFSKYGVISSTIIKDNNKKSKGFGFIELESEESLLLAIKELNNVIFSNGKPLHVDKVSKK